VDYAEKYSDATCKRCQRLAVDGTLEKLENKARTKQNPESVNNRGKPRYTAMQKAFAADPNVTTDPHGACLRAGYAASYAKSQALALREQMAPLIMEYQEAAKRRTAISVAKVQTELAAMGFANVLDFYHIEEDGRMIPKMLNELTREQAAAIQEVEVIPFISPITGEEIMVVGRVKLADKRANLVELGKTLGMFNKIQIEDKREAKLLMDDVPTDTLEQAEQLLLTAAASAKDKRKNKEAIPGEFKELTSPDSEK
jgi:hypothetical protein